MNRCLADPQNRSDGLQKRKITKFIAKMASVLAKSEWYAAKIADRTTTVYTNLLQLTGLGIHLEYIYNYYCMWKCIIAQSNRIQILQMHSYWFLFYFTQYKTFQTEILDLHKIIQHVYISCWMRYFWENYKDQFEPLWICLQNAVYICNTPNLFKKLNS